jgi:hypothetical protein
MKLFEAKKKKLFHTLLIASHALFQFNFWILLRWLDNLSSDTMQDHRISIAIEAIFVLLSPNGLE